MIIIMVTVYLYVVVLYISVPLSKKEHGVLNVCNGLSLCGVCEHETGTDNFVSNWILTSRQLDRSSGSDKLV